MSDFLGNIVRKVQPVGDLKPRLSSRFESLKPSGATESPSVAEVGPDGFLDETPSPGVQNPRTTRPAMAVSVEPKPKTSEPPSFESMSPRPGSPVVVVPENDQNPSRVPADKPRTGDQSEPIEAVAAKRRIELEAPAPFIRREPPPVSRSSQTEAISRDDQKKEPREQRSDSVSALLALEKLAARLNAFRDEPPHSGKPILQIPPVAETHPSLPGEDRASQSESSVPADPREAAVSASPILAVDKRERFEQNSPVLPHVSSDEIAKQVFSRLRKQSGAKPPERPASGVLSSPVAAPRLATGEQIASAGRSQPALEKLVHVTIGRIEIKMPSRAKAGPTEPSSKAAPSRVMTLDEYIVRRSTGGIA